MQLILLILVNITYCISDSLKDKWYRTLFKNDANDWVDLRFLPKSQYSLPLSTNMYAYAVRTLKFKFPFYEEKLDTLSCVSEGFLYMDSPPQYIRQPLYETRYIAPLMAGFKPTDPGYTPQDVRHFSNGTVYINQWSDMSLGQQREVGGFTFQVQLHCDGVIKFIYKKVPIPISYINDTSHVVKVGISDAYSDESEEGYHTFVSFNTITIDTSLIASNTTFVLTPTPTCGSMKYCGTCLLHSPDCVWCPTLHRCSTLGGLDQYYKLWAQHGCPRTAGRQCNTATTHTTDPEFPHCNFSSTHTLASTRPIPMIKTIPTDEETEETEAAPPPKKTGTSSTTIITTISITAVCIAAVLVISALLILKLRKPRLPIKLEQLKQCENNYTVPFLDHLQGNGDMVTMVTHHQSEHLNHHPIGV